MRLHRTHAPVRRQKWRMASIAASSVLALGWVSGCSVIYDLKTDQCQVDADCDAIGGVFTGLACIANICQEPPITGCQSNAECIDTQGAGSQPWACIDRTCVNLITTECPVILPQTSEIGMKNLRTNNPLILAGTGVIGGTTNVDVRLRNYDLAITELTNQNSGLPSGRQVVMLGCRATFDDEEGLDREMEHLTNVVKVPGIASAFAAADMQRAFNDYGKAAQMFFMSPVESDSTLAALQDDGLMWHILPGFEVVARTYAPLLTRVLTYLEVTTGAKVATVVTSDSRALTTARDTIEAPPSEYGLSFNGMSVNQNFDAGNYLTVNITSSATDDITPQVASIIALRPNVIVSAAGTQFVSRMIPLIESGWPVSDPPVDTDPPKPFYILSPDNYNDNAVKTVIQGNSSVRRRIVGVNFAAVADTTTYDKYVTRYRAAFPADTEPNNVHYENFYDAAYYLLYAAAGAGQNLTNGQSLLTGMNRLLSGPVYEVGTMEMATAMSTLAAASATIQLNGTLGPPDFNRTNGTRQSAGSVYCVALGNEFQPDVLRYVPGPGDDATQATLEGEFPSLCFNNF